MQNSITGALQLFDISHNQYTGDFMMGQIGTAWHAVGFGDYSGNPGETDMLMRNSNSGQFQLFDISHNQYTGDFFMGQVGTGWAVTGIVANGSSGGAGGSSGADGSSGNGSSGNTSAVDTGAGAGDLTGTPGTLTMPQPFSKTSDFFNQAIAGFAPSAPVVGGGSAVTEMGTGSLAPAADASGCITGHNSLSVSGHNPAPSQA
jgi:hypothetical protein